MPTASVIDISDNKLKSVPNDICKMPNLSVLNLSGNVDIKELPPSMGMLSRFAVILFINYYFTLCGSSIS